MRVVQSLVLGALLLTPPAAFAQRMSQAADAFVQDVNSLAGVSRIGAALFAADPAKKQWGEYCTASQGLARRGEFRQAIRTAAKALYLGEKLNANRSVALIFSANDIANAYSYAGDAPTATAWADRTLAMIAAGYESWAHRDVLLIKANALRIRALGLGATGNHAAALGEIGRALDGLSFGTGFAKSELQLAQASLLLNAGQPDQAKAVAQQLLADAQPAIRLGALRIAGEAALARNDAAGAKGLFQTALAAADKDPYQALMARVGLVRALRLSAEADSASLQIVQSLDALERLRGSFRSFEMRTALYGNVQDVFDEAVDFYSSRGDAERALAASEAGRARAMLDLQAKIDGGGLVKAGSPRPLAETQAQLKPGQVLVVYHQLPGRLVMWTITRDELRLSSAPLGAAAALDAVGRFRGAIGSESADTMQQAQALHAQLVAPLNLPAGAEVVFVPHRALHLLPFQALHDGSSWLVEKRVVSSSMSASFVRVSASPENFRLSAIGNPELGRPEWALPGAEREVQALAALYAQPTIAVQKEASKARLVSIVPNAHVLHVAAHAVIDEVDPMYSVIKLATSAEPLPVAGGSSDMEARELATLDLSASTLVSLSACSSGLGKVAGGDEFMGFKRALFAAGARSVLVSLWPVDDDATETLMTQFHRSWKTASRAQAMRTAQLKLLQDPRYKQPYFWAPFSLVGDPG